MLKLFRQNAGIMQLFIRCVKPVLVVFLSPFISLNRILNMMHIDLIRLCEQAFGKPVMLWDFSMLAHVFRDQAALVFLSSVTIGELVNVP